jgi:putative flippase GtrA
MMQDIFVKFIKFGLVGTTGMAVDFGVTWVFKEQFRFNKYIANSLGFVAAVISNFLLNRIWTFQSQDPGVGVQFGKFSAVALIGLGINNGIIYMLTERIKIPFYTSKLIATGIVIFWNFGANLLFTFK